MPKTCNSSGRNNINRKPPVEVLRKLRGEVGFGCPVPGCGNPYLEWHHFDPSWSKKKHHNPEGMIALCGEHHKKADAGAFTKEQLRNFKLDYSGVERRIEGRFDWMRRNFLAVVGGNYYFETYRIFCYKGKDVLWFERDDDGYILLNYVTPTESRKKRTRILGNYWVSVGDPVNLVSPPSGRLLEIKYGNGDYLKVEFVDVESLSDLVMRYGRDVLCGSSAECPITCIEIQLAIGGTDVRFGPRETTFSNVTVSNNRFFRGKGGCAIWLG